MKKDKIIQLFKFMDFEVNHYFFQKKIVGKYFVAKVCRQYYDWQVQFQQKEKKQFIPLLFTIGQVNVKNGTQFADFVRSLHCFKLK